jgi:hypothetical protein
MEAEVIPRISAEVCSLVFAELALILIAFIINGIFAVAKELGVTKGIKESVYTFSSVVALVVPGTGLKDGITQDTSPSVRTIAVHVIDILVRVKVKVRTVGLLNVISKRRGSNDAFIVSAVQVTQGALCLSLHLVNETAQGGGSSEEEEGVVEAHHCGVL